MLHSHFCSHTFQNKFCLLPWVIYTHNYVRLTSNTTGCYTHTQLPVFITNHTHSQSNHVPSGTIAHVEGLKGYHTQLVVCALSYLQYEVVVQHWWVLQLHTQTLALEELHVYTYLMKEYSLIMLCTTTNDSHNKFICP